MLELSNGLNCVVRKHGMAATLRIDRRRVSMSEILNYELTEDVRV